MNNNPDAKTSFWLGMASILAWIIPLVGFPVCVMGIIYGVKAISRSRDCPPETAIFGIIASGLFLLLTIGNSLYGAAIAVNALTR